MSNEKISNTAVICLSPNQGGMEIDAVNTAISLSKITTVILVARDNSFIEKKYKDTLDNHGIKLQTIDFSFNLSLAIIITTRKLIKKYSISNVIFFGASELKSLYFSFIGKKINLVIRHVTTKSSSKKDLLHRIIYNNVSTYIPISDHLKNNVYDILPVSESSNVKTLYPSLDKIFKDNTLTPKDDGIIRLLNTGSINDGKRQLDAIKACEVLYDMKKEFIFHIVGKMNPDYEAEINDFLETCPYKNSIKFESFTLNIKSYYKISDIFIFPSKGEGFGLSFAEALCFGLACISYDNTSFPEFKKLGFEFMVADNLSVESLKEKLKETITFIENNKIPLLNNIELAKKVFNEERLLNQYREILK